MYNKAPGEKEIFVIKASLHDQNGKNKRIRTILMKGVYSCVRHQEEKQQQLGLDIDSTKISALHRTGRQTGNGQTRSILSYGYYLISRKDKGAIMKEKRKLKGTGIVITDDLTYLNSQRLKRITQHKIVVHSWPVGGCRFYDTFKNTSELQFFQEVEVSTV